jgi:hypothetical protein
MSPRQPTIRPFTLEEAFPAYEFALYIAAMSTVCIDNACQFVDFGSHERYFSWWARLNGSDLFETEA